MEFDFKKFKRSLSRNDLRESLEQLKSTSIDSTKSIVAGLESKLNSLQRAKRFPLYPDSSVDKFYKQLTRAIYRVGFAASDNKPASNIPSIPVWRPIIIRYSLIFLFLAALISIWMVSTSKPYCPQFKSGSKVRVLIDEFATDKKSIIERLGFPSLSEENQLKQALLFDDTEVVVHSINVSNEERARRFCDTCNAQFIIYGKEYGFNNADLKFVIDEESYNYLIDYEVPLDRTEAYAQSFKLLRDSTDLENIECTIKLIRGLQSKALFEQLKTDPDRQRALTGLLDEFTQLRDQGCITSTAMATFVEHCRAWAVLKQKDTTAAIAIYDTILAIDPGNILALSNSGRLLEASDRNVEAEAKYEAILTTKDIPNIRLAKASVLLKQNKKAEASKEIEKTERDVKNEKDEILFHKNIEILNENLLHSKFQSKNLNDLKVRKADERIGRNQ